MSDPNILPFPSHHGERASVMPNLVERVFKEQHQRLLKFLTIRLGSPAEAEDVAQATFVRLWQNVGNLRNDNLTSLLFVTARNMATDALRSRQSALRRRLNSHGEDWADEAENVPDDNPLADRALEARQTLSIIWRILDELPAKCRSAFVAYRFESRSYREIAQDMGVTESMVRKYVLRATAHCAERFEHLEGWE